MKNIVSNKYAPYLIFIVVLLITFSVKLSLVAIGGPYTTIDDYTMFEGGFMVWFGQAPQQRMYFESWLSGIISIGVYISHLISAGELHKLSVNLVADAFRMFQENPDPFVKTYRIFSMAMDLLITVFVFLLANTIFNKHFHRTWLASAVAILYALSFNTLWCDLVARPDVATTLFSTIALWLYYKSDFAARPNYFLAAAIFLGIAAGFKLHAVFFVIFVILDLIRVWGLRSSFSKIVFLSCASFIFFLIASGSTLYDPLLYIKLRILNAQDDASPWIHWGNQFIVILRGTGWLVIPLVLAALYLHRSAIKKTSESEEKISPQITSIIFIACCWLILFALIRQLRAYWMLPVLPVFYCAAIYTLSKLPVKISSTIFVVMVGLFSWQMFNQATELNVAQHNQLRAWVQKNVKPTQSMYILGNDVLSLPRNTQCLTRQKLILENLINKSVEEKENFTERHVRLWEERSALLLIDMLNSQSDVGYEYYSFNGAPLNYFKGILDLENIDYILVQNNFHDEGTDTVYDTLARKFELVEFVNAPGGSNGSAGLPFSIYKRK